MSHAPRRVTAPDGSLHTKTCDGTTGTDGDAGRGHCLVKENESLTTRLARARKQVDDERDRARAEFADAAFWSAENDQGRARR